jgi:hypothetical protein
MNDTDRQKKLVELEEKLKKHQERVHRLLTEEDKAASSYLGNEYVQMEIAVYEGQIRSIKEAILKLKVPHVRLSETG